MNRVVEAIRCQMHAIAAAAHGRQWLYSGYSGQSFETLTILDLREISCAISDALEALKFAIRAKEYECAPHTYDEGQQ
jgi:hypothetical protein